AEAESSACFRPHAENETTYSDRFAEPQPKKFPRGPRRRLPIPHCARAGRLTSALVRAASTAFRFSRRYALGAVVDWIREATAKIAVAESLVAEAPCLVRFALRRNARRHGAALTPQTELAFLPEKEWPYRLHASIHADAANHILALASCSRNRGREFFLFLCPQEQS